MSTTVDRAISPARSASAGYRTLWRWHFYAGLFVMPFLVILAITGTLYCFQPQIEPLLYPHRLVVEPRTTPRLDADTLLARARTAMPADATPVSVQVSTAPDRSAEYGFRLRDGSRESVYVNPYDGSVLGTLSVENRFMQVDRMLHRKLLLGKTGELLMELAACWTFVMIGTGIALWWPRGAARVGRALRPDLSLRGRPLWKSLHATAGIWLAAGTIAFILTGLPWSGSWGKNFKALAATVNLGAPEGAWGGASMRSTRPGAAATAGHAPAQAAAPSGHHHDSGESMPGMVMDDLPLPQTPWAVGNVPVPHSPAAPAPTPAPLPLGRAIAIVAGLGVTSGYTLALPSGPDGVFTASYFPADPKAERTIYVDQYSGAVLKDIRYGDYGAVSKAVSYGTSLHMGRYFGLANQIICAVLSLGLAAMAVTGTVMWWKRRPAGTLGAPSRERGTPPMRGWLAGLVLLGLVFPLMGLTIVAVWLLDRLLFGRAARAAA
ncbi:PepSY-associated TM helix domain-containing protein [Burkholderia cenocepacia]|uniref:Peptidase n=1 Tax=Burkholderia cenocepacia TaxID=95486 RepID=A0AAD0ND05_9BURK|nr:PepSY domain-containing protein [Burkholderia cenocepacia]AWG29621.1 peptidase [Burkholderia cenocepacia]MBR8305410.1 PepSY domain-containing protein [Burkholderia cenocepacia]MDR8031722.1 PepSY domain-containing protein [Burkholderia cenocepacia]MDR8040137.1 PepSY domain-containing protein [Burkholderia cenocepacia]PRE37102.1 PepSY domain-containing protein [Burkholderia cenocepacia]